MSMAIDNLEAAHELKKGGRFRSAVSRAYYAAFAAGHALGLHAGAKPRASEQTWEHARLPNVVHQCLLPVVRDRHLALSVKQYLVECRRLRVQSDYIPLSVVDRQTVDKALHLARKFVGTVRRVVDE